MYTIHPSAEVEWANYESWAFDRFRLLEGIWQTQQQKLHPSEKKTLVSSLYQKYLPADDPYRDVSSHFALRFIFSRCAEDSLWFVTQEVLLLQFKLSIFSPELAAELSREIGFTYEMRDGAFLVPWIDALELVGNHLCEIKNGFAHVPLADFHTVLLPLYRSYLWNQMDIAFEVLPSLLEDDRMVALANALRIPKVPLYVSADVGAPVNITTIDAEASTHFPPCMAAIHRELRTLHHINNDKRMHYILFLKSAGMHVEDLITLFRQEFVLNYGLSESKFMSEHAYNIKHAYGLIGGRTYYSYGCRKLAAEKSCPFTLGDRVLDIEDTHDLVRYMNGGMNQHACNQHFIITQKKPGFGNLYVSGPVAYFTKTSSS